MRTRCVRECQREYTKQNNKTQTERERGGGERVITQNELGSAIKKYTNTRRDFQLIISCVACTSLAALVSPRLVLFRWFTVQRLRWMACPSWRCMRCSHRTETFDAKVRRRRGKQQKHSIQEEADGLLLLTLLLFFLSLIAGPFSSAGRLAIGCWTMLRGKQPRRPEQANCFLFSLSVSVFKRGLAFFFLSLQTSYPGAFRVCLKASCLFLANGPKAQTHSSTAPFFQKIIPSRNYKIITKTRE